MRWAIRVWLAGGLFQPALAAADGQTASQGWRDQLLQGCWACDTLNQVSDIGLKVANQAFAALSAELTMLTGLLMGLWVLFFAARLFMPFGPEGEVAGLWNKAAKKLFLFAVVLGFLQNSQAFWDYLFTPLMSAGFGIAGKVILISDPFEAQFGKTQTLPGADAYCSGAASDSGLQGAQSVMHQMDCPLAKLQSQFGKGMLIGEAICRGGGTTKVFDSILIGIVIKVASGIFLMGIYFLGFILYPLLFIDVAMRTTVIAVVSPLMIAACLFVPTRGFAVKAVWHLVQSALTLVFAAAVGGIAKAILAYSFSSLVTRNGQSLTDWDSLIGAIEAPASGVDIDLTQSSYYQLVGVAVLLLYMLRRARFMASEFTSVDGSDFSGAQTGAAASVVGKVAHLGGNAVQSLVKAVTRKSG